MKLALSPVWVSPQRCAIGENPLWDNEAGTLQWIDISGRAVHRLHGDAAKRYDCPGLVGSLYLAGPHRLLVAMRSKLAWLHLADGRVEPVAFDAALHPDERFNDGRVDADGTLWISTMDRQVERGVGSLVRFDEAFRGVATPTGAIIGNGVCFSHDGRWTYFSDSRGRAIHRYAREGDGRLGARERLVELDADPGRPDGCSVDAEGCLWSARIGGGRIDRYAPDGRLLDTLPLPVAHPTHCTFGGPDLRTLFVTTARFEDETASADASLAGAVLAYEVDAQGRPEHRLRPTG